MLVPAQSIYKWQQINFQVSAFVTAVYQHTHFAFVLTTLLTVIKVALALDKPNAPTDTSVAQINVNFFSSTPVTDPAISKCIGPPST
eukprot:4904113-Ditylum_brightwellii.AAC.1